MKTTLTDRELLFTRDVSAPVGKLYRAWTEPELLVQWFTPRPWTTLDAQLDVRPGGIQHITMQSPEGKTYPNTGIYLEVVPNQKLVWTNAFVSAWEPTEVSPTDTVSFLFTGTVSFTDLGNNQSRYTARVTHWTAADCAKHAAMGFQEGWGQALDQLLELTSRF